MKSVLGMWRNDEQKLKPMCIEQINEQSLGSWFKGREREAEIFGSGWTINPCISEKECMGGRNYVEEEKWCEKNVDYFCKGKENEVEVFEQE